MKFAASLIFKDKNKNVLFVKRNSHLSFPKIWSMPSITIYKKNDSNTLKIFQEKLQKSLGVKPIKIKYISEKIGKRKNDFLLMQLYLCEEFEGSIHLTKNNYKSLKPKYIDLVFKNPKQFLSGKTIENFNINIGGECTKCLYRNYKKT